MKLVEHQGKRLLSEVGVRIPDGAVVTEAGEAAAIASTLGGRVVLKAQIPVGKRGRSGAVRFVDTPAQAQQAAAGLLGSAVSGFPVAEVLVERAVPIARELYAAVFNDAASGCPLVLFSTEGGMDIEEVNAASPEKVLRLAVDIRAGLRAADAEDLLTCTDLNQQAQRRVAAVLVGLYALYRKVDADLVEVNPLALTDESSAVALDVKLSLDPGALARHHDLVAALGGEQRANETTLEHEARRLGLQLIELDGDVGVLANGAGLTMTTLDAITHYGGQAADFLEIGGDAYTKATPALRLLLNNPKVRSLLVNFCGAFARTDVMTRGVVAALDELRPDIPVFFSIHGTGESDAVELVRDRLKVEPYQRMEDAVQAAVAAARGAQERGVG
ncbi:MAG: ATP-grasp domain-containing protein [Sciscionella sp.]